MFSYIRDLHSCSAFMLCIRAMKAMKHYASDPINTYIFVKYVKGAIYGFYFFAFPQFSSLRIQACFRSAEKTEELFKNRVENAEEITFCGDLFILKETLKNHIFSVHIDA